MYVPKTVIKKFVEKFYKEITQGHNRAIGLVLRL